MARKKAKENLRIEPQVVEEYATTWPGKDYDRKEDVPGIMKVIRGRLETGTEYIGRCFIPNRTPAEQAEWEKNVRAACWEFIEDYARHNGWEAARKRFAVE